LRTVSTFKWQDIKGYKFGYSLWGKPTMYAHIYYVDGLLIDTGQHKMSKEILAHIGHLKVAQIFITHHHEDHTGNVELLQDHFKCPVYASELCCQLMQNPEKISMAQKMVWGDRPACHTITPITTNVISTPNHQFELIPIPGHAPEMIALYEPQQRWLFSADLYVHDYISYFLHSEEMATQIASIKKILELDFELLLCGHNPKLTGGKERLARKLAFLESFYQQVAAEYQHGLNAQQIFKKLQLRENWYVRLLSQGALSKLNMVKSVIRDEQALLKL
jgi:glyoxylase-like metal-dependent hydrolase (beta-lactamase superfamily II)